MTETVSPVPQGFNTVTPYLALKDGAKFLEFAKQALGATVDFQFNMPDSDKLMHASLTIGNSKIMVGDPMGHDETPANLYVYLDDPDAAFDLAVKAGATAGQPMTDMFYGDRSGCVKDAFGNTWWFSKHVEEVDRDELTRRFNEMQADKAGQKNAA